MTNIVCIDIETIPDTTLPTEMGEIVERKIARKRGDNKDPYKFGALHPEFGEIVALGIGLQDITMVGEPTVGVHTGNEEDILSVLWQALQENRDGKLVTFEGKRFDIPYILKRSILLNVEPSCKIPMRRFDTQSHFDVGEVLSNYGQGDVFKLGEYCTMYGVPHNHDSAGSDVYESYKDGKIQDIADHCKDDVLSTMGLYKKVHRYF